MVAVYIWRACSEGLAVFLLPALGHGLALALGEIWVEDARIGKCLHERSDCDNELWQLQEWRLYGFS